MSRSYLGGAKPADLERARQVLSEWRKANTSIALTLAEADAQTLAQSNAIKPKAQG
jgi:hypothetical protein